MNDFVGREKLLAVLSEELGEVKRTGRGRFVVVRGRRQVGKSRLVDEFCRRSGIPYCYFQAARRTRAQELAAFTEELSASGMPIAFAASPALVPATWSAALAFAVGGATAEKPALIVLDELPNLLGGEPAIEGELQAVWDRVLRRSAVLLVVIGSDLSIMESLATHGRPLYGRPTRELPVDPLDPHEVAQLTGLEGPEALDAYLVVGGLPLIALAWRRGESVRAFLRRGLNDSTSALVVAGERITAAEFPTEIQARPVLSAIASGESTFGRISSAAGVPHRSLQRSLETLISKRVIERLQPLSSVRSDLSRYVILDPYIAFWLRFVEAAVPEIERGRGDLAVERVLERWGRYRGRAIEPLVRRSIEQLLPDARFGSARYVGSFWNRKGDVEVDLVGSERVPTARKVDFIGSIKWREREPFGKADANALASMRAKVPGSHDGTRLIGVSRGGFRGASIDVALEARDLVAAWATRADRSL